MPTPPDEAGTTDVARADIKNRAFGGMMWFMSGTAARALVRVIVTAVLSRVLTPADFGVIGAAGIFLLFADLFSTPGITVLLVQKQQLDQRHIGSAFVGVMVTSVAMAGIVVLLSGPLATMFGMPQLKPILMVLALLLPLNSVSAVSQKLLERAMGYKRLAMIQFAAYVFGYAAISMAFAALGFGVWSLVFAQLGSSLLQSGLTFLSQPHNPFRDASWKTYAEMMRTGMGYNFARYANVVATRGDYFVVGKVLGAVQLGFYQRAYVLMDLSNNLLTNALNTVLLSAFSRIQHDRPALGRAYLRVSALLALIFCSGAIAASVLAPEVIAILLGPQWGAAVLPFRILALGMFFRTGHKIAAACVNATAEVRYNSIAQAVYAVCVVGGAMLTIRYGIVGVAISTLFALGVAYVVFTWAALRVTGLSWLDLARTCRPALLCCAVVTMSVYASASMLRAADVGPLLTLLGSGAVSSAILLGLIRCRPDVLGEHGAWIAQTVLGRFKLRPAVAQ